MPHCMGQWDFADFHLQSVALLWQPFTFTHSFSCTWGFAGWSVGDVAFQSFRLSCLGSRKGLCSSGKQNRLQVLVIKIPLINKLMCNKGESKHSTKASLVPLGWKVLQKCKMLLQWYHQYGLVREGIVYYDNTSLLNLVKSCLFWSFYGESEELMRSAGSSHLYFLQVKWTQDIWFYQCKSAVSQLNKLK